MPGSLNINFATPGQIQSGSSTNAALNPAIFQQVATDSALAFGYQLGPLSASALSATNCQMQSCQTANASANRITSTFANTPVISGNSIVSTAVATASAIRVTAANVTRLSADALLGDFYYVKNQGLRNREIARYDRIFNGSISASKGSGATNTAPYLITGKVTITPSLCCKALDITVGHNHKSDISNSYLNLNTTQFFLMSSYNNNFNVGDSTTVVNYNTNGWDQLTQLKYGTNFAYLENCTGSWQYQVKDAYRLRWDTKSTSGLSARSTVSLYTVAFVGGYAYPATVYGDRTFISVREILAYD